MRWQKRGRIVASENWAQCPTPFVMEDRVRVYFSSRDKAGKSYIRFVDLDLDDPRKILDESRGVVLPNGRPGTFCDEGQIPSYVRRHDGTVELWFSGWNSRGVAPYHNSVGIAVSNNGGRTFTHMHDGPVMDRTPEEPYLAVTPCLDGDDIYYITGLRWEHIDGKYEPIYAIAKATMTDKGIVRDGDLVIDQQHRLQCFSRPWIAEDMWRHQLWYCYRSAEEYRDGCNSYRIGLAEKEKHMRGWVRRDDDAGIHLGDKGEWDSLMQCYPAVIQIKDKTFMLYNGNGFGKHGFGLAVAE